MNLVMFILPAIAVVLLSLPLVRMFTSKVSKESAKWRLMTHIGGFFGAVALTLCLSMGSALGAGIAVAAAAPAAIGAFSENDNNFGKALIFVALGEGVAIYGLLISILIINAL